MHRCQTARRLQSRLVYLTHLFYKGLRNLIGDGPAEPPGITRRARVTHQRKSSSRRTRWARSPLAPAAHYLVTAHRSIVNDPFQHYRIRA